jgi:CheY-like chemotaxis protein
MPQGGLIRIELGALAVDDEATHDLELATGDYISITVTENGLGMDAATLARVFEPFFTTKSFGKGSGLGMAMVYGFVKQSGGGIRIASTPGQGSTVSLLLPAIVDAAATLDDTPLPASLGGRGGGLVLLVEDDPDVRRIVRMQLTDLGHPVLEAENGPEAIGMIENVADIALMLTDIVMPGGIDGWALARFAREHRPQMRVVLMSGYAYGGSEEEAEDPDLPMLTKPFEKSRLAQMLQATMP